MSKEDSTVAEITDFLSDIIATARSGWKVYPRPVMFVNGKHRHRVCHTPKIKELYTKDALDDFTRGACIPNDYKGSGSVFLLIGPDRSTVGKKNPDDYKSHAIVAVYLNHVLYMYDPDWTPWSPPPPRTYKRGPLPETYTRRVTRSMRSGSQQAPLPQRPSHSIKIVPKKRTVRVYPEGFLFAKIREELCGTTYRPHHRPYMKVLAGGGENVGKGNSLGHSLHFIDMLTQARPQEADFSWCQEELGS